MDNNVVHADLTLPATHGYPGTALQKCFHNGTDLWQVCNINAQFRHITESCTRRPLVRLPKERRNTDYYTINQSTQLATYSVACFGASVEVMEDSNYIKKIKKESQSWI